MTQNIVERGQVLLAEPFMLDPNFKRAAVLLCEHGTEGSIGFIMNRPMNMQVNDLMADFPEIESPVYFGGPVQTDTLHYIHGVGELLDESHSVSEGVYWGGDFSKLKFLIRHQLIQAADIRFFVGYSGWSEGQLVQELAYGSWITAQMDANYLFRSDPDLLWQKVMGDKGSNFAIIAEMPDSVYDN